MTSSDYEFSGAFKGTYCICHTSIEVDLKSRTEMWVVDYLQTKTAGAQGTGLSDWEPLQKKVLLVRLQRKNPWSEMRKQGHWDLRYREKESRKTIGNNLHILFRVF